MDILGVPLAPLTIEEAVQHLLQRTGGDGPYLVFTPNPEMVDRSLRDREFRRALLTAQLRVADGVGLLWASRMLKQPLPGTVPGVELMHAMLAECAAAGVRVFLLGTTPEAVSKAAQCARERYPGLEVVGHHHGFFPGEQEGEVVHYLRSCSPGLTVSGMGVPRDQFFAVRWRDRLPPGVHLAVGGGLDILAGLTPRAPRLMRRLGLEWLFRLVVRPGRWRRQLALPRFAGAVLRRRLSS